MSHEILYPDTDYTNLVLKWGRMDLNVYSLDKDGDLEIDISDGSEGVICFQIKKVLNY